MHPKENVPLKDYSTMRVGGTAKYFAEVTSETELVELIEWAHKNKQKTIAIGGGSNIIWRDQGYDGLVILNRIKGHEIVSVDDKKVIVKFASGENWDEMVQWSVDKNLSGIEQLSWIPGRVGATPVQNVGAYGKEVGDVLVSVRAYDKNKMGFVEISKGDCQLGYRTSRFKTSDKGRFIISAITLELSKNNALPPFYASLQAYFDENKITEFTPENIRRGVISIRSKKLPDPDIVANNGSFFANPIIDKAKFANLKNIFPDIVSWPTDDDKIKLSAGWLVEHAGFKDYHDHDTGMATWSKQALVIINENAHSTNDVLNFKQKIVDAVEQKYGITLEQEPELI
ncbi:MAG TPA: UDP-N-acetylmuramate dehydrogenase [Candidatus Saccharibacteria bacterium]|nr:UDP-N-acetylmuramate dehydrogenase [Candidatus Saccharibacteria bacterium]